MDMEKLFERLMAKMDADRKAAQEDLLAKMDANQAKAEADRKADRKANQAKADADRVQLQEMMKMMHADQAKAETRHKDFLARMDARWNAWQEIMNANHDETVAYQEVEARPQEKEPTSVDTKPEAAEERQVPEENATVMTVEEPKKKRRRDRQLAAERRRHKQKISTLESCGPPKELAVARRGTTRRAKVARKAPIDRMYRRAAMARQREKKIDKKMSRRATVARRTRGTLAPNMTRHAKVARRRGHIIGNNQIKNNVARGQRFQVKTEGGIGVKNEYTRQRLHPGNVRTASRTLRKTQGLDVGQQAVETSSRLQAIKNRTLWSVKRLEIAKQLTHLLSYCKEVNTGSCGGVDPLKSGKSETACMGGTGGRSTGLPMENECAMNESNE
jgi:hypothetical protein